MNELNNKYNRIVETFLDKIKKDKEIIGVISYGSIVNGNLWEDSDIDIWLISKENNKNIYKQFSLIEEDVDLQVELYSRKYFIELAQSPQNYSIFNSIINHSKLLYCTDNMIKNLYSDMETPGTIEKEGNLLRYGVYSVTSIKKVKKTLNQSEDIVEIFNMYLKLIKNLSCIEIALHNQYQSKLVEVQALKLNPVFWEEIYVDLLKRPLTYQMIENSVEECTRYLVEKTELIFAPIINWLETEGEVRGTSEVNEYIVRKYSFNNEGNELTDAYNWLTEKNILIKTSESIKIVDKSKYFYEEAAYAYNYDC